MKSNQFNILIYSYTLFNGAHLETSETTKRMGDVIGDCCLYISTYDTTTNHLSLEVLGGWPRHVETRIRQSSLLLHLYDGRGFLQLRFIRKSPTFLLVFYPNFGKSKRSSDYTFQVKRGLRVFWVYSNHHTSSQTPKVLNLLNPLCTTDYQEFTKL